MFQTPDIFGMAAAMADNAATRLSAIAQNVANADTPGYRAKDVAAFADSYQNTDGLQLRTTRPGHMTGTAFGHTPEIGKRAGGNMSPNGNNVSIEDEMMRAATVRQDHDTALAIYKKSLDILRTSLGRG